MATILIIDDEQAHRDHAAAILRRAGFDVQTAGGGKAGLECVAAATPRLIFCDALMPELDGYEVLARVRADPKSSGVAFVFFTAVRYKGAATEARGLGSQGYLVKPFKAETLIETAHRLLGTPGAAPANSRPGVTR